MTRGVSIVSSCSPLSYYSKDDLRLIREANTYEELLVVALAVLAKMPPHISMVCGPITTGGLGCVKKNLLKFDEAILMLAWRGENVFTQMPYEVAMQRIKENKAYYKDGAQLLWSFYYPIFASGMITRLCFLPDWRTSGGAMWERERADELGISCVEFCDNYEKIPFPGSLLKKPACELLNTQAELRY